VRLTEDGGRSPAWSGGTTQSYHHCMVGGCVLTGAELQGTSEPVWSLYDALKPKLHYAYDRCANAYLRMPT